MDTQLHPVLRSREGFMFIELLIVLGIMGILSVIVITAINPSKHFCQTHNSKLRFTARELTNAVNQYEIKTKERIGGDTVPVGELNAKPICRFGIINDATCINADALVPAFILDIPADQNEINTAYSGFKHYRLTGGIDFVIPANLQTCSQ